MSNKSKGSRNEVELAYMLYEEGYMLVRSAGSGRMPIPNPDLIAGNKKRILAIECKSLKKNILYLSDEDILQIVSFSKKFGAEPWIAVRFNNLNWYFINPKILKKKNKNFNISKDFAQKRGLNLKQLIKG